MGLEKDKAEGDEEGRAKTARTNRQSSVLSCCWTSEAEARLTFLPFLTVDATAIGDAVVRGTETVETVEGGGDAEGEKKVS
jgi:hypothetical protein